MLEVLGSHRRSKPNKNNGPRILREKNIVALMINKYCVGQGHIQNKKAESGSVELCTACLELLQYSHLRLEHCRFGEEKTTCEHCSVHCYKPDRRLQIKSVMKYAGPRMLWSHPLVSLRHALDRLIVGSRE